MYGNSSLFVLNSIQEVLDDVIFGAGTVGEVEFHVFYAVLGESFSFVLFFVKSDDKIDAKFLEDGNIVFWSECSPLRMIKGRESYSLSIFWLAGRSRESDKLAWNNPVEIAVLDLLKIFVISQIEALNVKPLQLDCVIETSEAVQDLFKSSVSQVTIQCICRCKYRRRHLWSQ